MHPVSASNGTVPLAPVEDGVYSIVHVDWNTGKEISKIIFGDSPVFNTAGGFIMPINENSLYLTGVFGPVLISKLAK